MLNISSWSTFCWSHLIKCVGARIMFACVIFNKGPVKRAYEGLINFISSDRSSCSRPLTTYSHNLLALLKDLEHLCLCI